MSGPMLRLERAERVAILRVHRPEKRNALSRELVDLFHDHLRALAEDADIACLVIAGGETVFVSGADVAELLERGTEDALRAINGRLFRAIEEFPRPTIAAVRGWALGGGCELALACDLRVAGRSARFGQPEVGLGIVPGAGAMHRLARLVGLGRAKEMVLVGTVIDAATAHAWGLVSAVVNDDRVEPEAIALAGRIAGQGPDAVRLAKRIMNLLGGAPPDTAAALESLAQGILFESEDKKRRMRAFLDRRREKESR